MSDAELAVRFPASHDIIIAARRNLRQAEWDYVCGGAETAGVVRVLEIIQNEIEISMGLLGIAQVDRLGPAYLTQGTPVRLPHEMSAFPHLPVDRLK